MATGSAWNLASPKKPVAEFDKDAVRDIPVNFADWLADAGTTYLSHTVVCQEPLESPGQSVLNGVITVRIQLDQGSSAYPPALGAKFWFRTHIVGADGQEEDQTLYLKIVEK